MGTIQGLKRAADVLTRAVVIAEGSVWVSHNAHSISWSAALRTALRYGVTHRLVGQPPEGASTQEQARWHGMWLDPYYFVETAATRRVDHDHPCQVPPFPRSRSAGTRAGWWPSMYPASQRPITPSRDSTPTSVGLRPGSCCAGPHTGSIGGGRSSPSRLQSPHYLVYRPSDPRGGPDQRHLPGFRLCHGPLFLSAVPLAASEARKQPQRLRARPGVRRRQLG